MRNESTTKVLILLGYILLVLLAGVGIFSIYGELRKISDVKMSVGSEEIITVSNVLATLYEVDNNGRYSFSEITPHQEYIQDSLIQKIKNDLLTLKEKADDSLYISKLDSVEVLIDLKQKNDKQMKILMDSIINLPLEQHKMTTTVLSQKELTDIESVIRTRDMQIIDSTTVVIKQKSFFQKVSDLFSRNAQDSISLNTVQKREMVDSIVPIAYTTDTIAQYVTGYVSKRNYRYSILLSKLSVRQFNMQSTNKVLLAKIDYILKSLEERDAKIQQEIEESKNKVLANSAQIGYTIALAAVIVVLFFLTLTYQFLNKQIKNRKQLEISKARTESLLTNKEQLMLAISHDIKAPLSSIIGFIEILSKVKLPEKEKYFLQNMQISSEQILELVNNLLDFHKLDLGKFTLNSTNFVPYTFVNDIFQSFVPIAESKSLKIHLTNEIDSSKIYNSDPFRIKQIANNLISNALKFTKKGSVHITAKIKDDKIGQKFIVSVKDTGIGISQEDMQRLFKQYERTEKAEVKEIEGFGLGLAISQRLANLLEGNVTVVSELGKGSTFTLEVPLNFAESKLDTAKHKIIGRNEQKLNLLFVDDDKVLLNVYFEMLKQLGYEPKLCNSSLEALDQLQNDKFDIVFCDIQMPDMNGFELVERIRNATFFRAKEIPVIALSARSDVSLATYKDAGFTTFLPKPFSSQQLLAVIDNLSVNSETNSLERINLENNMLSAGFSSLIAFAEEDKEAAKLILNTFIEENNDVVLKMKAMLLSNNWEKIQGLAHKLLPRMRMIGDSEIVAILYSIEKGEQNAEKLNAAFSMIEKRNLEAFEYIETL